MDFQKRINKLNQLINEIETTLTRNRTAILSRKTNSIEMLSKTDPSNLNSRVENELLENIALLNLLDEEINFWKQKLETQQWIICNKSPKTAKENALEGCSRERSRIEVEKNRALDLAWCNAIENKEIKFNLAEKSLFENSPACEMIWKKYFDSIQVIKQEENIITKNLEDKFQKEMSDQLEEIYKGLIKIQINLDLKAEIVPEVELMQIQSRKNSEELIVPPTEQADVFEIKHENNSHPNLDPEIIDYSSQDFNRDTIRNEIERCRDQNIMGNLPNLALAVLDRSCKLVDFFWDELFSDKSFLKQIKSDKQMEFLLILDESLKSLMETRKKFPEADSKSTIANHYRACRSKLLSCVEAINDKMHKSYLLKYPSNPMIENPLEQWLEALKKQNKTSVSLWKTHSSQIIHQIEEILIKNAILTNNDANKKFLKDLFTLLNDRTSKDFKGFCRFFIEISRNSNIVNGNFGFNEAVKEYSKILNESPQPTHKDEIGPAFIKKEILKNLVNGKTLTEEILNQPKYGYIRGEGLFSIKKAQAKLNKAVSNEKVGNKNREFLENEEKPLKKQKNTEDSIQKSKFGM